MTYARGALRAARWLARAARRPLRHVRRPRAQVAPVQRVGASARRVLVACGARRRAAQKGVGDVVYVPTPQIVVDTMLRMAKVGPGDYADRPRVGRRARRRHGRDSAAPARSASTSTVICSACANESAQREGVADRATFREQNLFETDLAGATVITTYLLPEMNLQAAAEDPRAEARHARRRARLPHGRLAARRARDPRACRRRRSAMPGVSYVYLWHVPARRRRAVAGRDPVAGRPRRSSSSSSSGSRS